MSRVSVETDRCRTGALHYEAAMSSETTTTLSGNLTAEPEVGHSVAGARIAQFAEPSTSRMPDSIRSGAGWGTLFLRCRVWACVGERRRRSANGQPRNRDKVQPHQRSSSNQGAVSAV